MLRFLIADDHELIRSGLKHILQEEFAFAHIDEAADTATLISKAITADWNLIISDLAMPGGGGLEALRQIRLQTPAVPVLIVSLYPEEQYALRVIKAGAAGYLNKSAAVEELVNAVHRVLSGRRYITAGVAEQLSSSLHGPSKLMPHELLSEPEFNVLRLIATGNSNTEIAEKLSSDTNTISTYYSGILSKMNLGSSAELIEYALENKLI